MVLAAIDANASGVMETTPTKAAGDPSANPFSEMGRTGATPARSRAAREPKRCRGAAAVRGPRRSRRRRGDAADNSRGRDGRGDASDNSRGRDGDVSSAAAAPAAGSRAGRRRNSAASRAARNNGSRSRPSRSARAAIRSPTTILMSTATTWTSPTRSAARAPFYPRCRRAWRARLAPGRRGTRRQSRPPTTAPRGTRNPARGARVYTVCGRRRVFRGGRVAAPPRARAGHSAGTSRGAAAGRGRTSNSSFALALGA